MTDLVQAYAAGPPIPFSLRRRFWTTWALRHLFGAQRFSARRERELDELLQLGRQNGIAPVLPVPSVSSDEIDPDTFHEVYLKGHTPVVLRGFARDWPALSSYSPSELRALYGGESVPVRIDGGIISKGDYRRMPLSALLDNLDSGGDYIATGIEDLMNSHPELREQMDLDKLNRWVAPGGHSRGAGGWIHRKIFSTEIFLAGPAAMTSLHCAFANNLFVMIHGRKRWTMVAPEMTPWIQPEVRPHTHFHVSNVDHRMDPEALTAAGHEAFQYAPRYEIELAPGDALFSPQWWWHAVENLDVTVGVSNRALCDLFYGNPLFSVGAAFSAGARELFIQVKKTGWASDDKIDHAVERWLPAPEAGQATQAPPTDSQPGN